MDQGNGQLEERAAASLNNHVQTMETQNTSHCPMNTECSLKSHGNHSTHDAECGWQMPNKSGV